MDLHQWLDVVLADQRIAVGTREVTGRAEHLRIAVTAPDRQVGKRGERIEAVLRRLYYDDIARRFADLTRRWERPGCYRQGWQPG